MGKIELEVYNADDKCMLELIDGKCLPILKFVPYKQMTLTEFCEMLKIIQNSKFKLTIEELKK